MAQRVDVRQFINLISENTRIDFQKRTGEVMRDERKGAAGFIESLNSHTSRLIDRAQSIADKYPHLSQNIQMAVVGSMLYFHELGKLRTKAKDERHSPLKRVERKRREKKHFESVESVNIQIPLRRGARIYYDRYDDYSRRDKHDGYNDKEALFAHFLDKTDIALIHLNNFENPSLFDNGSNPSKHVENIERLLKPARLLIRLLPREAQDELLEQITETRDKFKKAGYGAFGSKNPVTDLFNAFIDEWLNKERDIVFAG